MTIFLPTLFNSHFALQTKECFLLLVFSWICAMLVGSLFILIARCTWCWFISSLFGTALHSSLFWRGAWANLPWFGRGSKFIGAKPKPYFTRSTSRFCCTSPLYFWFIKFYPTICCSATIRPASWHQSVGFGGSSACFWTGCWWLLWDPWGDTRILERLCSNAPWTRTGWARFHFCWICIFQSLWVWTHLGILLQFLNAQHASEGLGLALRCFPWVGQT